MAIESVVIYFSLAVLLLWLHQLWDRKSRRLPPGPFQLPVIGNILQIQQADSLYPYRALYKLSKKYGNVMYLKIGAVPTVVMSGYETIKDVLNQEDFLNRFDADWFLHRSFGKKIGLLAATLDIWRPTRRFTMRHLRDFGFGKTQFQQQFINREMEDLSSIMDEAIESNNGMVEPHTLFRIPSVNIAWASAAAQRFDHKDPKIIKLVNLMAEFTTAAKLLEGPGAAFPLLAKTFPKYFNFDKLYSINEEIHVFLRNLLKGIKSTRTYKTEPNSFIESFLQQMEKNSTKEDKDVFNEENLISILYDLFVAGSDTTSSTMTFALLWLTMYPEVQKRLREELESVVGSGRLATLEDKPNLPYARAVILELHRKSSLVPLMPRKVYKDTAYGDMVIPADTMVICNLYSAMNDDEFWGDPQNFRPSRFLDNTNKIINAERVINFATGKRNCIGEIIAESTIFAFVTQLVQRYDLLPASDGQVFDSDPITGAVLSAKPFTIKVRARM